MFIQSALRYLRILALVVLVALGLIGIGCGGGSSQTAALGGPLSGNWQITMTQNYPTSTPSTVLSASGFLVETNDALSGSVQGPTISGSTQSCGGAGPLTGTVNQTNVTFSLNPGGTVFNFTGVLSSDNASISGTYSGVGGACLSQSSTSGTFSAQLIPPLNGSFTGTFNSMLYMPALTGTTNPVPVSVSGSLAQGPSAGGSVASVTGTITAVGYPCFTTASMTGTISGQNLYLSIYAYNGEQIGFVGNLLSTSGAATWGLTSSGWEVTAPYPNGFYLGTGTPITNQGPCPAVYSGTDTLEIDQGDVTLSVPNVIP